MRHRWMQAISVLFLSAAACGHGFTAAPPTGFAAYERGYPFQAVSPDGVLFQVRRVDPNVDGASLEYWTTAAREQLVAAGFELLREQGLEVAGQAGQLLELSAPQGPEDFIYLVALTVTGDEILLIEASGQAVRYEVRRAAVLEAARGVVLDR